MTIALVGASACALAFLAHWQAARENRGQRWSRVMIFDAWRALGVMASGWVFGSVLALAEPYHGLLLPISWALSLELSIVLGVMSFAFYTWEWLHERHTWQRYPRRRRREVAAC